MGTVTLTQISNGDALDATTVDNNFDLVAAEINGGLDNDNIDASAAIGLAKLEATAWATWTPTITPGGSMTYTSSSVVYAKYKNFGRLVFFSVRVTGTVGGSVDNDFTLTLPVTSAATLTSWPFSAVIDQGLNVTGLATWSSTTALEVRKSDSSNFASGALNLTVSGFYEAAS